MVKSNSYKMSGEVIGTLVAGLFDAFDINDYLIAMWWNKLVW